jgi:hypothetical protein
MPPKPKPRCPFLAGPAIENSQFFVGRKNQLQFIIDRMQSPQPISVNIIGRHRIGKTSLLCRFYQHCNVAKSAKFVVIYLSLQDATCQEESSFYAAIAKELKTRPLIQKQPQLLAIWQQPTWNRQSFAEAIKDCKTYKILPVLCLDKFDALFQNADEFNNGFYDSLHHLINHNFLMLVITTLEFLEVYQDQQKLTSSFFNVGHNLVLDEFTEEEADKLVRLPASTISGSPPALSPQEQRIARHWGGRDPYLLQLASYYLWSARQQKKPVKWAKQQFQQQTHPPSATNGNRHKLHPLWLPLRWLGWDLPVRIGSLAKFIGATWDDLGNWILGLVVITGVLVVVLGIVPWEQVKDLLEKALGG